MSSIAVSNVPPAPNPAPKQVGPKPPYKVPEVVTYSVLGRAVPALVLSSRIGEVSRLGANGEPYMTLAIVKQPAPNAPHKRPSILQNDTTTPEIEIVHDVVHASHKFSAAFKEKQGLRTPAQIADYRGHGEWSEHVSAPNDELTKLRAANATLQTEHQAAIAEAAKQRANADLAMSQRDKHMAERDEARTENAQLKNAQLKPPTPIK